MSKKLTIEYVRNQVEKILHPGSLLLSNDYIRSHAKLDILCEKEHKFKVNWNHISNGKWCPYCAGNKVHTYEFIKDQIENRLHPGAKLLSKTHKNAYSKLEVKCENGHSFMTPWTAIQSGDWCSECSGTKKKTIEEVKAKIENELHPGAKLLSTEYKNNSTKLDIICENGHEFKICWADVNNGYWCNECSSYKGERTVRLFFNTIFNAKFPKSKPRWLKNKEGAYLELDGYNEDLKIAFEHQGKQHYEYNDRFHSSQKDFEKIKEHDRIKLGECNNRNITLIIIPDIFNILKIDIKDFVKQEFEKLGRSNLLPVNYNDIQVDYTKIYKEEYKYIKTRIENILHPGSKLLSKVFVNNKTELEVQCENGHIFNTLWEYVNSGRWCKKCYDERRSKDQVHSYNYIKNQIENMLHLGSKLISNSYVNSKQKLEIQCEQKYTFKTDWCHISQGKWCPACAGNMTLTYDYIKNKIENVLHPGSKLLSKVYINSKTKLDIQCQNGHIFQSTWSYINSGNWCHNCFDEKRSKHKIKS